MSLINQLLQDLEQRQAGAEPNIPIEGEVRSVPLARKSRPGLVASMVLFPVAAIAAAAWMFLHEKPVPPVVVKVPALVAPAPIAAVAPVTPVTPAVVMAPTAPTPPIAPVAAVVAVPESKPAEAAPVKIAEVVDAKPANAPPAKISAVKLPDPAPEKKRSDVVPSVYASAATSASPAPQSRVSRRQDKLKIEAPATGVVKTPTNPAADASPPAAEKLAARTPTRAAEIRSQKTVSPQQLSDNLYKQSVDLMQQGKGNEARQVLRKSLEAGPNNAAARQMLVSLLVEGNNLDQATALLQEGVKLLPDNSGFRMNLARLQIENADTSAAMLTLEEGLRSAGDDPQYHAFYAALFQRSGRHEDAIQHYLVALRSDPSMANWLVGIGVSLQAAGKESDAAEAFQRAKDTGQLPSTLVAFVDQRLSQLKH